MLRVVKVGFLWSASLPDEDDPQFGPAASARTAPANRDITGKADRKPQVLVWNNSRQALAIEKKAV